MDIREFIELYIKTCQEMKDFIETVITEAPPQNELPD